jgi:hypothetical protein
LLRTKRCYGISELVMQFKIHILPLAEAQRPGIYHASSTILDPSDKLLGSFLQEVQLSTAEAFLKYNLAQLAMRRDIAMLAVLQRASTLARRIVSSSAAPAGQLSGHTFSRPFQTVVGPLRPEQSRGTKSLYFWFGACLQQTS